MTSHELRQKFIRYFVGLKHKQVAPASLVPADDSSVLFTSAGMQQFKDYFINPAKAPFKRAVSVQPCFRTSDIELVGDKDHLTFFEMLGNFSFGDYFKSEAIEWAWQFAVDKKWLGINLDRITVSVFGGDKDIPKDEESIKIYKTLGVPQNKIKLAGRKDNFWGPVGNEGPCGPTSEIYIDDSEVWNIVFTNYYCGPDTKITPLKFNSVDTGMGLERLSMVMQEKKSVYETDIYTDFLKKANQLSPNSNERYARIIADHIRGAVFIISDGVIPSNKEQGYVLRRLIRRAAAFGHLQKMEGHFLTSLAKVTIVDLAKVYPPFHRNQKKIIDILEAEQFSFDTTLAQGMKQLEKIISKQSHKVISGHDAFTLYDSFGFPLDLTREIAQRRGLKVDEGEFKKSLQEQVERSRKIGLERKQSQLGPAVAENHTATHLLHQALREILGKHVRQAGQDLTPERLRFDFTHPRPLTPTEIKKIEELVNQKIKENLPIKVKETTVEQAKREGAMALFTPKYGERVTLYNIGDFSKELCKGPHVKRTGEIGLFKIVSEKSSSAGIRRIKAVTG